MKKSGIKGPPALCGAEDQELLFTLIPPEHAINTGADALTLTQTIFGSGAGDNAVDGEHLRSRDETQSRANKFR